MNEKDSKAIHDLFYEFHNTDNLGLLKSKLVEYVTAVRQEVWQAAIDEALAFANEDLSNTNVLVLIEQHLKPRREAAANSVPKDSDDQLKESK